MKTKRCLSSGEVYWGLLMVVGLSLVPSISGRLMANMGYVVLVKQQPIQAEMLFVRTLQIDDQMTNGWDGLGQALIAQDKTLEAVRAYDTALTLRSKCALILLRRAYARQALGNAAGAQEDWRSIGSVVLMLNMGQQALTDGDSERAVMHFRLATEIEPQDWRGFYFLAAAVYQEKRFDEAQAWIERGLKLFPDQKNMLLLAGRTEYALGNFDQAVQLFSRHIELWPDDFIGWHWRGIAWEGLGALQQAAVDYQQAIVEKPDDPNPHLRLAVVLERLGNKEGALLEYRTALEISPGEPTALRAVERLSGSEP